jgi:hypothetical protein
MRNLLHLVLALALSTTGALAHDITDVSPASGSLGTSLTITGTGFGTKKPSVFLTSPETGTKIYKLKVTSSTDTTIVATVTKGVLGSFDVNVEVAKLTVTSADAFSLVMPSVTGGQTATADIGATLTLAGTDFGTKKGKLAVAGKNAKVLTWTDTSVSYVVPSTVPNGPVVVYLSNKLGGTAVSAYLTVTGSSAVFGKDKATGTIGKKKFKPLIHFIFISGDDWSLTMTELGKHARSLSFEIFDLGTLPAIFDGTETTPATATLTIAGGGGTFDGLPGQFTITITHHEDEKFVGAISGEVSGEGGVKQEIKDVEFTYSTGPFGG